MSVSVEHSRSASVSAIVMGVIAAMVGFASSFAVVLSGLSAAGASADQAASGLMALSLSMGISGVLLSLCTRKPISVAWSTPGAALLISTPAVAGFEFVVGAFIVCAVLLMLTGFSQRLNQWIAAIPRSLASAMLAGVLFSLCLAPFAAIEESPFVALAIIAAWVVAGLYKKLLAVPAALCVLLLWVFFTGDHSGFAGYSVDLWPALWIAPEFSLSAIISIALPLFIVTMASQNIPGYAVLSANGYQVNTAPLFATTGFFSLLSAPFGGHAVNLAAITAAMCAGPEAHPDPERRYWSAVSAGVCYVLLGLLAGYVGFIVGLVPIALLQAVAGLALLGAFCTSIVGALGDEDGFEAPAITFFISASGISLLGIGGAFWGLVAGLLVRAALKLYRQQQSE